MHHRPRIGPEVYLQCRRLLAQHVFCHGCKTLQAGSAWAACNLSPACQVSQEGIQDGPQLACTQDEGYDNFFTVLQGEMLGLQEVTAGRLVK